MKEQKNARSLHLVVILMLSVAMVIFMVICVIVTRQIIPGILVNAERNYLVEQYNVVKILFNQEQERVSAVARDISVREGIAEFIQGKNPEYFASEWGEGSPARAYRVNHIFIKDIEGNGIYRESYDYLSGRDFDSIGSAFYDYLSGRYFDSMGSAFSASLSIHSAVLLNLYRANKEEKREGILFFQGLPYYICIVPIILQTGEPAGTVTCVLFIAENFFKRLTQYPNTSFRVREIPNESTPPEVFSYSRINNEELSVPILYRGISTQLLLVDMIIKRPLYGSNERILSTVFFFLVAWFAFFVILMYLVITQVLLSPLERLAREVHLINISGEIYETSYGMSKELRELVGAMNYMLERFHDALQKSRIVLEHKSGKFKREE
ncbi:hypothetical protein FACS1894172_09010 [Spirochaetia bacterium]|nr:hypothetical protein FACS1894164_01040 [Spirochaetia bacterium]GHU32421.1 hypothetical protein FACS1894172_09010 [Spirochaetia bacterium]